jgi:hypothetical protein
MPAEIILDDLPYGIARNSGCAGEKVSVQMREFISSADGQEFVQRLEGWPAELLQKAVGSKIAPAQVDTLLAIIRRDKSATVYVNELDPVFTCKTAVDLRKDDLVYHDDLVDILKADLGVDIPADAGVIVVFSWGWRKGLFFDYTPLHPDKPLRSYDFATVLSELYGRLLFEERYRASDAEWQQLFAWGWFPLAGLANALFDRLLAGVRANRPLSELTPQIAAAVRGQASQFLRTWLAAPTLAPHGPALESAVQHFLASDFAACASSLYPTIAELARSLPHDSPIQRPGSLLLPQRFDTYLREVYLPMFKPTAEAVGPADAAEFSQRAATIAMLVVQHLCFRLDPQTQQQRFATDAVSPIPAVDADTAAERWGRWFVEGSDETLQRLLERLTAHLPMGWRRLDGPPTLSAPSAVASYVLDATADHVGVTLSIQRNRIGGLRGGRVVFAAGAPPTATIASAWAQVMQFLDTGIVAAGRAVQATVSAPSGNELFLEQLPYEVAWLLEQFSRSARKILPLTPADAQRWQSFVIGAFRAKGVVNERRLVQWLIHEGWDEPLAHELKERFNEQCQLLSQFIAAVAVVA